jgi:hypothetical protein
MSPRTAAIVFLVSFCVPPHALAAEASAPVSGAPGLVINEDNSHFFGTRPAELMTVEGLNAFVDQYAGTKVTHLFLNPNAMRASFRSSTRDAIWDEGTQTMPKADEPGGLWPNNARLLHERGLDPYAVWIARAREKGIVPWLSMRMNDVHCVNEPKNFMHSSFWVQHPEYWRVPGGGGWTDRALDYGRPEVREHAMAFVRELLDRYDPEGLELDWMRFGWHFAPGKEAEGAELLCAFMREVRGLTKEASAKRGHMIRLGARVPADPDAARGLGMDGVRWVKEGLVDMLVPCPFWTTSDFDIPLEKWREQTGDAAKSIVLAPGLEYNIRAHPGGGALANDLESVRGFAAACFYRGADQIYLFNFMDSETIPVSQSDYRILLNDGMGRDIVTKLPRRHVATYHDTVPGGFSNGAQLPLETAAGGTVRLNIGPAPVRGRSVLLVGLAARDGLDKTVLNVTVNGQDCAPIADCSTSAKFPGAARAAQWECPVNGLKPGYNAFGIRQTGDSPSQQAVWVELRIIPEE